MLARAVRLTNYVSGEGDGGTKKSRHSIYGPLLTNWNLATAPLQIILRLTHKSASPGPLVFSKLSLSLDKEGLNISNSQKKRHPSPFSLGTAEWSGETPRKVW